VSVFGTYGGQQRPRGEALHGRVKPTTQAVRSTLAGPQHCALELASDPTGPAPPTREESAPRRVSTYRNVHLYRFWSVRSLWSSFSDIPDYLEYQK